MACRPVLLEFQWIPKQRLFEHLMSQPQHRVQARLQLLPAALPTRPVLESRALARLLLLPEVLRHPPQAQAAADPAMKNATSDDLHCDRPWA
jgi:hypothetical protein